MNWRISVRFFHSLYSFLFSLGPSRPKSLRDSRIKIPVRSYSSGCSVSNRFCINRTVLACLLLFSLNVRQSLAWRPSLLPAAMTIVAILASSRSFSPPGSLLPISYPCLGRLGVRAPSGNLLQFKSNNKLVIHKSAVTLGHIHVTFEGEAEWF